MLRAADEKGGVGVYAKNIARHLIERDPGNEYFLYFASDEHLGRFSAYANVKKRLINIRSKLIWDQVAIPYWARRDRLDVIFHPKFTVPLLCGAKSVMVLHGAGWFIPEVRNFWSRPTRIYARLMMPVYCKVAGKVISVSEITRDNFIERLGVDAAKIRTIYFAPGEQFRRRFTSDEIEVVKQKYGLPDDFILTISGGDRDDRKNFSTILNAFSKLHSQRPCKLVVAGRDCEQFRDRYAIPDSGYGADIVFTGWVDQEDLPAFYQSASVFVYPSNMEAHPIPITEALACGTPIVTSNVYGLKELAGDAALLADPRSADDIAQKTICLLDDPELRSRLAEKARLRSELFTWERCAAATLGEIHAVGNR